MGDETAPGPHPEMQRARGRLHHHRQVPRGREVERELVRGGRARGRHRAREPSGHRAVDMAARDALHLRMTTHDVGQPAGAREAHRVHRLEAGHERRVVHEQQRGALRGLAESRVEPVEALPAQLTAGRSGHVRVEADQAHRPLLDRVVEEAARRQVAAVREGRPKRLAPVVVAGHHVGRHGEPIQDRAQARVLRGLPALDQVAGDQRHVRPRGEPVEVIHRAREVLRGVEPAVVDTLGRADVGVGDLGDEHAPIIHIRGFEQARSRD